MTDFLAKALPAPTVLGAFAALSLITVSPASAQDSDDDAASEMTEGEERLARMLEGRVAGEPLDCIRTRPSESALTIQDTAYVYGRGKTIYVQQTRHPEDIDRNDIVVIQRFNGTRLCRLDLATTIDRNTGFFTGNVQFDQFIPYTRVEDEG